MVEACIKQKPLRDFAAQGLLFLSYRLKSAMKNYRNYRNYRNYQVCASNWCSAAFTMLAASTPKKPRSAARVSLRPKPSVPSVR